jgi:prepilin-type N-terminal cleavage/methylation domain-containing protein
MRRGMTLFEMLMVLVIVVGLLAIGVPGLVIVNNGQRVNNAANSLAAALSQARARAIFDKRPHGIRLIATDPDNPESNKPSPQWFDTIEFISLPPPISEGFVRGKAGVNNQLEVSVSFSSTISGYLMLNGQGQPYLATANANTNTISLNRDLDFPVTPSDQLKYTIFVLSPQSVAGLRPIQLPKPVVVDATNSYPSAPTTVLFAPDGSVFQVNGQPPNTYAIVFWIDRYAETNAGVQLQKRGPILVAVYPRTGKVATYPVNTEPDASGNVDPYYYVKNANAFTAQ